MFKRFTSDTRASVAAAVELSKQLGHPLTGPEHLLVGMYRSGGVAARVLAGFGITEDDLMRTAAGGPARQAGLTESEVDALRRIGVDADDIVRRAHEAFGPLAGGGDRRRSRLDADAKRVLEQGLRESLRLRHRHLGTEHLLLATLAVRPELVGHGVDYETACQRVLDELRRAG